MPASASIARAIFSMSISSRLLDVAGLDVGLIRFLVHRDQHHHALLSQVEINHANPSAFAFARYRPADFARAVGAGNDIACRGCSAIQAMNAMRSSSDPVFSACFWKVGVSITVRMAWIIRGSRRRRDNIAGWGGSWRGAKHPGTARITRILLCWLVESAGGVWAVVLGRVNVAVRLSQLLKIKIDGDC